MLYRSRLYARVTLPTRILALASLILAAACGQTKSVCFHDSARAEAMTQEPLPGGETWAMQWVIPVRWAKNVAMQAGTGHVVHHAKSIATTDGDTRYDDVRLCGVQQPSYKLQRYLGDEHYGPQYPVGPFDAETLPTRTMVTHLHEAGGFVSDPLALQLGVALDDPDHAPWPDYGTPLPGDIAQQADGSFGFATRMRTDIPPFAAPPVNMLRTRRAHTFHVALRHIVGACGFQTHAGHWEGRVQVAGIGGKAALHTRVLGCELQDGSTCTDSELFTLNSFSPKYIVTGPGHFVMQRVSADTPCEEIRTMDFVP